MREIKFRAFDKTTSKNGVMVPWSELKLFNCGDVFLPCEINMPEVILMQFTGIKDKDSQEIYEGDICNVRKSCKGKWSVMEIIWSGGPTFWSLRGYWGKKGESDYYGLRFEQTHEIEVIGNIHEHSHLLK